MKVLKYLEDGNLRNFLNNNLIILIGKRNYIIHHNFHPGNILSYDFKDSEFTLETSTLETIRGQIGEGCNQKYVVNEKIDEFIQNAQLNSDCYNIDGYIENWDTKNQQWKRSGQLEVVLKKIDGLGDINENFLNEIR
ncbi:hypothetical protein Glove_71g57 [Diversispora epigaea]|uniref:Protein kinase domain-containing protein n=1 Tax=Diversispora epigaea TaxID=1348612 RepID=A0A397JJG9_9GLOM|nr:hypothetical protein Glove_71g57 [Diversispora epigaea]